MKKTYTQSAEEVLQDLGVGPEGLTTAQAQERLAKYGPNKLKEAPKPSPLAAAATAAATPAAPPPANSDFAPASAFAASTA